MTNKYYYLTSYVNYKGGVGNLQSVKIYQFGLRGGYIKCFTSQSDMAEKRAIAWIKKNSK